MKTTTTHLVCSLLLTFGVSSIAVAAEPSAADREIAREAFGDAMASEEAKDFAAALVKYQKANLIMNIPPTGLAVARMHEHLGHLVEARDAAVAVALIPVAAGESQAFTDARTEARTMAEQLKARIPTLRPVVQGLSTDLPIEVFVDGQPVAPATALDYRPMNPGSHTLVVRATGYKEATVDVALVEKDRKDIAIDMERDPSSVTTAPVPSTPMPVAPAVHAVPQPESGNNWAGWSLVGVGAAGMGLGLVSWLGMRSARDTMNDHCDSNARICDSTGLDAADRGKTWTAVNTVSILVGAVGIGAGAYLILSGSESDGRNTTTVGASSLPAGGSVFLHQTF